MYFRPARGAIPALLFLLVLASQFWSVPAQGNQCRVSQGASPYLRVLVLSGTPLLAPWYQASLESFRQAMREEHDCIVSLEWQPVNMERYVSPRQREALLREFAANHAESPPHLVVTLGNAIQFALEQKQRFFADIPVVATAMEENILQGRHLPAGVSAVIQDARPWQTAEAAQEFFGPLQKLVVVIGNSPYEQRISGKLKRRLAPLADEIELQWLENKTHEQVVTVLENLSEGAAVLFTLFIQDAEERWYYPREVVGEFAKVTQAPVFVLWGTLLGTGAIGGVLMDPDIEGRVTASQAIKLLQGKEAPPRPLPAAPIFDWRVLQRFGLDAHELPQGSILRNKPPSLWQAYRNELLIAAAAFALLGLLSAGMVFHVMRRRRAEAALRESEARFHAAVDNFPYVYLLYDKDLKILFANKAAMEKTGLAKEYFLGKGDEDIFPPEVTSTYMPQLRECLRAKTRQTFQSTHTLRSGASTVVVDYMPLLDEQGQVRQILASTHDITELKKAEEALLQAKEEAENRAGELDAVLDALVEGLVIYGPRDGVMRYNQAAASLLGLDRGVEGISERKRLQHYDIKDENGAPLPLESVPVIRAFAGETVKGDVLLFSQLDEEKDIWVLANAAPIVSATGDKLGTVATFHDITSYMELQKELEDARTQADKANQAKSAFLAAMSHEIRTPLHGIMGMIKLAELSAMDPRITEYMALAKEASAHLLDIINDVLDLAKIEAGRMQPSPEPFFLRETVASCLEPLKLAAQDKGLYLTYTVAENTPNQLSGDAGHLRQVLTNIAGNAVKFTREGGVQVRVRALESKSDDQACTIEFTVEDTGIGIPEHMQTRVFDSFEQVCSSAHAKFGGTGLGLSISKRLVELMGGELVLVSSEGAGSTFTITAQFQIVAPQALEQGEAGQKLQTSHPLRILVAEDDRTSRVYIQDLLEHAGHNVALAENGRQALDMLAAGDYDLVLMDIRMPELNGDEATRIIRNAPPPGVNPDVPVIALTAYALQNEIEPYMASGFNDYLTKPLEMEQLRRILADF